MVWLQSSRSESAFDGISLPPNLGGYQLCWVFIIRPPRLLPPLPYTPPYPTPSLTPHTRTPHYKSPDLQRPPQTPLGLAPPAHHRPPTAAATARREPQHAGLRTGRTHTAAPTAYTHDTTTAACPVPITNRLIPIRIPEPSTLAIHEPYTTDTGGERIF